MIRFIITAIVFAACPAFGQESPTIKTKIVTYALGGLPENFMGYFKTGEEIMMFRASDGTLGVPIRYHGPKQFILRDSEAAFGPPPPGKQPNPPVAVVNLPENSENVLVLAAPTPEGKVKLMAYDISANGLRNGEYRVFNFSHSTVSVILGRQTFALSPGGDTMVKDSAWHDKIMAFPIRIATVTGKVAKPVYSNFWEHQPANRTLLFMFNGNRPSQAIRLMDFAIDIPRDEVTAVP